MLPGGPCSVCDDAATCASVCQTCFKAADKHFKRKKRKTTKQDLTKVVKSKGQRLRSLKDRICNAISLYDKSSQGKSSKVQEEKACVLLMEIEQMCNAAALQTSSSGVDVFLAVCVWTRDRESGQHALCGPYLQGEKNVKDLIPRVPVRRNIYNDVAGVSTCY
jgi:hypothetical protein